MRLVSLACSNTEIVCALGCADWLVATDDHSDRPEEIIKALPRVGPDLDIDIEAVCELEPDLVLASNTVPGHENVIAQLEAAGLEYLVLEPVRLPDVYLNIREIAAALGVKEEAKMLIQSMQQHFALTQVFAKAPKVVVTWWHRPSIVPGRYSWVTDLIQLAGGINPLAKTLVKSTPVSDEQMALINPDVIILSWCGVDPANYRPDIIYKNTAWQAVQALKNKQVYCIPEAYLGRPGPGLVQGFSMLKEVIRKAANLR